MSQITHVVLVRWKPDTSEATIGGVRELSQSLRKAIPGIETLREGPSVSPEGLEGGFAYGLVIEFEDEGARDAYLVHPAHLPLAEALRANAESLVVFDVDGS